MVAFHFFKKSKLRKQGIIILVFIYKAVVQRCSVKKVFLEISQNPQENTCARVSFLIILQVWGRQLY